MKKPTCLRCFAGMDARHVFPGTNQFLLVSTEQKSFELLEYADLCKVCPGDEYLSQGPYVGLHRPTPYGAPVALIVSTILWRSDGSQGRKTS